MNISLNFYLFSALLQEEEKIELSRIRKKKKLEEKIEEKIKKGENADKLMKTLKHLAIKDDAAKERFKNYRMTQLLHRLFDETWRAMKVEKISKYLHLAIKKNFKHYKIDYSKDPINCFLQLKK